jgi:hypothetical protein
MKLNIDEYRGKKMMFDNLDKKKQLLAASSK